jgi:hypothetical protein
MLRSLVATGAVFVLLASSVVLPGNASAASRCPADEPETLISLYRNSDAIYVAHFDKIEEGAITDENENYISIDITRHFTVSRALKGENRKFVVLPDQQYRTKHSLTADPEDEEVEDADKEEGSEVPEEEDDSARSYVEVGDDLLLFVKKAENGELALTHYRDGTKRMTPERLPSYEARLTELNAIFGAKKLDESRLVDWVVRTAEEPHTRWEGAYELLQSFQAQEWQEEAEKERAERIARGEEVAEPDEEGSDEADEEEDEGLDLTIFTRLLTDDHKQRLANVLLGMDDDAVGVAGEETAAKHSTAGDEELLELVTRWGDPRLLDFLLARLPAQEAEPYRALQTMNWVAKIVDDDELRSIAEKFGDVAWENAEEAVKEDEGAQAEDAAEKTEARAVPVAADDVNAAAEAPVDAPPAITYGQLRSDLLRRFTERIASISAERAAAGNYDDR